MASLIVIQGPNLGDYYPLGRRTVVIGRDEACPVQVLDHTVSRKHVQIRFDARTGRYIALDMRSANGVCIDDCRLVGETALRDGDEIRIGSTTLIFLKADFPDRHGAFAHFHKRGERQRATMLTPAMDAAA
jgi:pSer/pThr/pTyr-binding forkhead associated (FHA) protein